jgi:hypothetical protein
MKFIDFLNESIILESFIKEKFKSLPSEWKTNFDPSKEYKIQFDSVIKDSKSLDKVEEIVKNKKTILISLGNNTIMMVHENELYVVKDIDMSAFNKTDKYKFSSYTYPISTNKITVNESTVKIKITQILEKLVDDCFDLGTPLNLDQSIKLLGLSFKNIIDKADDNKSKSQSNSSSGNSNKNESSHSDQNIKKYMNDRVIPKITEIKKSIPTIEKLETALVDIKSGKANPVKINNIISRINDLKKLLEDYT